MDPAKILQIITNSTWMVTKLVATGPVEFDKTQYTAEVSENTTTDRLLQLTARLQPQVTGPVEFRIKEGNQDGVFALGISSGLLSLLRPLDYEEQQEYELTVEVRAGEATSEATVVVRVVDENDHTPVFPRTLHETQITEEDDRHLPKTILTVTATDGDAGEYGQLEYSLTGDGVYNNGTHSCFAVDRFSGEIHLLKPLDRDPPSGRSQWRLRVGVTDGEREAHTAVHINLKDINDNAPFFPQSTINATISENTPQGASVAQVLAEDNDDPREAHNARLVYSLEKNVIDEASGRPIFAVDSDNGLITTAICCLDREKTQRYAIQVVATDGGGLKGTGTVLVEVADVNDVPPRFSRPEWTLDVAEHLAPEHVLATLSVVDQDVTNDFTFRVVPGSGRGWQMFRMENRAAGTTPGGDLRAIQPLDYENHEHRKGFRFRVQVTDLGEKGWEDKYHVDGAWVNLNLVDDNDNSPEFEQDYAQLTLAEDTPPGTLLATFPARDVDRGGHSRVRYTVEPASDPGGRFNVDDSGAVRVSGVLDREETAAHAVRVLAIDDGVPQRTATATLIVNVTDVNDNPPFLAEPREVQVMENSSPQTVARLKLGDPDDWRQGHGPPFTISLDPRAPPHIRAAVDVKFDRKGDEGRGVGVVSTRISLDREERRALLVPLVVGDAGVPPLSTTVTLTLHVADLNDNPMSPAAKIVTVHSVQPHTSQVPLGRVYVKDPDDWDAAYKTYAWRSQHPRFMLNTTTGDLSMKPGTSDGRYELGFVVSDASQGQVAVPANVTVDVKSLSEQDVAGATPVTLAADPYHVVRQAEQGGQSMLAQLVMAARAWVGGGSETLQAVSVQEVTHGPSTSTQVWMASPGVTNLHHILLRRRQELEHAVGISITDVGVGSCSEYTPKDTHRCKQGCWVRASIGKGFTLVDANTSAVVGPMMSVYRGCGCRVASPTRLSSCGPNTCLNGGKCLPTSTGSRCICPQGTTGSRCKILSRHFEGGGKNTKDSRTSGMSRMGGGGWAWVPSIPQCSEVHVSMEVLTASKDATLLYTGPDHQQTTSSGDFPRDVLSLELRGGRPSLMLDLGAGPATLHLNASYTLSDSKWHRLDFIWKDELVEMIVDLCSGGSFDGPPTHITRAVHNTTTTTHSSSAPMPPDAHTCRGAARLPKGAHLLNTAQPLQVGGFAHPAPSATAYGWPSPLQTQPLKGCVRNLRVNGQLLDLGEDVLAQHSVPGCPAVDCSVAGLSCGVHGRCHGSPGSLRCECQAGWAGPECAKPTVPAAFQVNSYVKLALSFTPLAYTTTVHLRFRTWKRRGELVVLSSQHGRDRFAVQLLNGRLCVVLRLNPDPPRSLCLTRAQLTDGRWHTVAASRHGSATFLAADDAEGDLYNASVSLEGQQLLEVDKQEGVHIGGSPEYVGVSVFKIHGDYHDGCIDDVRISGKSVPLPPAVNGTAWGQASMLKGVDRGCRAPPACTNVSCRAPLTCVDTWRSYHCGCGEGRMLSTSRVSCEDEDECIWEPCLNGGTCLNRDSAGYVCACPTGFGGQHCHLQDVGDPSLKLSLGALVAIVVWCTFLLLLICAFLLHQHQRRSALRRGMADVKESVMSCKEAPPDPCQHTPNLLELKLLKPTNANGQPAWTKNPNIADVDVLQVDAASVTSSMEDQKRGVVGVVSVTTAGAGAMKNGGSKGGGGGGGEARNGGSKNGASRGGTGTNPPSGDDLRNYAYEGEGSSPGSLSSCLESCSGSGKFFDGFREVAHMLESWDPTSSHFGQSSSSSSKNETNKSSGVPVTTIRCDIHASGNAVDSDLTACHQDHLPPRMTEEGITTLIPADSLPTPIPMPIPDPPRAFTAK